MRPPRRRSPRAEGRRARISGARARARPGRAGALPPPVQRPLMRVRTSDDPIQTRKPAACGRGATLYVALEPDARPARCVYAPAVDQLVDDDQAPASGVFR